MFVQFMNIAFAAAINNPFDFCTSPGSELMTCTVAVGVDSNGRVGQERANDALISPQTPELEADADDCRTFMCLRSSAKINR